MSNLPAGGKNPAPHGAPAPAEEVGVGVQKLRLYPFAVSKINIDKNCYVFIIFLTNQL
jgi:hypothetical protein